MLYLSNRLDEYPSGYYAALSTYDLNTELQSLSFSIHLSFKIHSFMFYFQAPGFNLHFLLSAPIKRHIQDDSSS